MWLSVILIDIFTAKDSWLKECLPQQKILSVLGQHVFNFKYLVIERFGGYWSSQNGYFDDLIITIPKYLIAKNVALFQIKWKEIESCVSIM